MTATRHYPADVLAAVVAKFRGEASLAGIAGPFLDIKPPDVATIPYAIVTVQDTFDDGWTCESRRWSTTLGFEFWNRSPEAARGSCDLFLAVFGTESLSLSITGGSLWEHRLASAGVRVSEVGSLGVASVSFRFRTVHAR